MDKIKLIEVRSEIAAGTRGASLGVDAVRVASLNLNSDFFSKYDTVRVKTENEVLFQTNNHPTAKHIDSVYIMVDRTCEATYGVRTQSRKVPIILAGDHSTAAGTICGLKKAYPEERLGVIWIDAHADLHSPYTTPSGNMHGMPLAMVTDTDNVECKINDPKEETVEYWNRIKKIGVEGPKVNFEDIVFIAVRDTEEPEDHLIDKNGIKVFSTEDIKELGIPGLIEKTMEQLDQCDAIYVSFDVDSMDSRISMGTGTPVPGGLTFEEALELNCELIKNTKVCAWEMVEVNPTLDKENIMANNAFRILEATTNSLIEHY